MKVIIKISSLCFLFFISGYAIDVRGPTIGTDYTLEGRNVDLACLVTDSDDSDDVNWAKIGVDNSLFQILNNGSFVDRNFLDSDYSVTVEHINPTQFWCNMSILTLSQSDLGEYTCWYSSGTSPFEGDGLTLDFAELPYSLVISESLNGVTEVIENVPDTLTCTAYGSKPEVSIHWTIDGISVDEDSSDNFPDGTGNFTTYSNITYTYNRTDHGMLVGCSASNIAGTTIPTTVTLDVLFPASITNPNEDDVYADAGGEAVLRCEAEGNPPPDFTWIKNNTVITGGENHTELHVSEPVDFTRYSTLTIESVVPGRDNGDYNCTATNPHGYQILTINLRGRGAPEPAKDVDVTSAMATSLTVTWTEGQDGGYPQNFTVEYTVYEFSENWNNSPTVDYPPVNLTMLESGTKYEIIVRSDNRLGSAYSEKITHSTKTDNYGSRSRIRDSSTLIIIICVPCGLIVLALVIFIVVPKKATDVKVESATATTLTVTWKKGTFDFGCGKFTVEYKKKLGSWEESETTESETTESESVTLTKLQPLRKYVIRVRTTNTCLCCLCGQRCCCLCGQRCSAFSDTIEHRTAILVRDFNVTSATATTITVTWAEGEADGDPPIFTVEYKTVEKEYSQTVGHPPFTLTNLRPMTEYKIRVRISYGPAHDDVYSEYIEWTTSGLGTPDNNTNAQIQGSKKKKTKKSNTNINAAYSDQPPEVLPPIAIRNELVSPQQHDNETNFENISQEKKPKKNPEGLVYAELDLKGSAARVTKSDKPKPKDGQNTYASIDFNQTALLNQ